jgi:hypothetical protein
MFDQRVEAIMPAWLYDCDPIELTILAYGEKFTLNQAFSVYWYLSVCPVAEA